MKAKRLPMRKIRTALAEHLRRSARGKANFQLSGDALDEAINLGLPVGVPIKLADGRTFTLEDQFAEKNTAFSAKMFQRYKLQEVKPLPARPRQTKPVGGAE